MGSSTKVPRDRMPRKDSYEHGFKTMNMEPSRPDMERVSLTQADHLRAADFNGSRLSEREGRRAVRTRGHGAAAALPAGRSAPLKVSAAVSETEADTVVLTVHTPPTLATPSSKWTGRRTLREQVHIVRTFAPLASDAVAQLAEAIEQRKGNDPAYADALQTMRELHGVLGELIAQAERGRTMTALLLTFERKKDKLRAALADNAQLLFVDPVRALAAGQALEWVSSFTGLGDVKSNPTLVGAIYCALLGREALAGRKSKNG